MTFWARSGRLYLRAEPSPSQFYAFMLKRPRGGTCKFPSETWRAHVRMFADADRHGFATILLCDLYGVPHMATLITQPFGSRRAPEIWARATVFLQFAPGRLFDVWMAVFFEDCFCAVPEGIIASALSSAKTLRMRLHVEPPCKSMESLGACVAIVGDSG